MKVIIIVIVLVVVAAIAVPLLLSSHTELGMSPAVTSVGVSTPVTVHLTNPHGVRHVSAYLEQNGVQFPVYEQNAPARRLFWKSHEPPANVTFEAGKKNAPNLKDGKARLVVEAVSNDLRASTDSVASDVTVILTAPRVIPDDLQHYINQAGMELVTFTPSGSWDQAGVKVGPHTFRSFPLPGHPEQRFSMFAYAWDLPPDITPVVYARNQAGTEATGRFWFKLFPKKFRERDFVLDDALMDKLVNNIDSTGTLAPGPDLLSRFLKINGDMRRQNNQQLADLRLKTEEKILWNGPFIHWGKEEANFADVRDYMYKGKKVDRQVHLGFDLSDTANAPVHAANDGKVVWADNLGIYGNCVVLDHGYGLQSIYGHMQRIDVKVGDMVMKNGSLGLAGSTGLAEGVHVHFGMQIDGVQINPREWWDEHWIHDRILSKLQPGK
ncbi:MAG TPA: peptidoglycan DD-metalloendopeptidase family protein [Bryobacteraceae bacterium]|nr:peptidoglycan DD-metalloendopeptidase family protein [Bryobacteraceae bacterium]